MGHKVKVLTSVEGQNYQTCPEGSITIPPRICGKCQKEYSPTGLHQKYCKPCKRELVLTYKRNYYEKLRTQRKENDPRMQERFCPICKDLFQPNTVRQTLCKKHYCRVLNSKLKRIQREALLQNDTKNAGEMF